MTTTILPLFFGVSEPRVSVCILLIGLCTYITGGEDYQDMRICGLERSSSLGNLLSLPNGVSSKDI